MKCIQAHRQSFASQRWLEFVNSVASGMHLGISLHSADDQHIQVPEICPKCSQPIEYKKSIAGRATSNLSKFELEDGSPAMYTAINEMLYIVVRDCSCHKISGSSTFDHRAEVACELLSNFYHCLQDGIQAEHRVIELSMLRQMNRITLSLFQGDDSAVDKAFDLVLSAAIILLDAEASQLEIAIDGQVKRYSKGDMNRLLQHEDQVLVIAEDLYGGSSIGRLAVINPVEPKEAGQLLPLLAQECSILLEIENLFKLMQSQISQWLGAIGSSLLLIDRHHTIVYSNRLAEELLEKTASELLGNNISQVPGPWVKSIISRTRISVAEQMDRFNIGQEIRWVDWQVSPFMENDEPCGWIIIINDRTDVHRWQEASRRAERFASTATLVGSLAHELRNPLSAATGLLQILSKKRDPGKIAGYTDLILRELDRISRLLNEFLLLGRPANISLEPIDLKYLLDDLLPLLQGEASSRGHEITIIDSNPISLIWGDAGQLTQVILNLVRNALEAMPEPGKVILSIEQDDKSVNISVRDFGPGIPAEALESLFQPFFTTKERGTGLGLPVVQAIVNNHGGQIHCCNVPDGGAEFRIELIPYQGFDGKNHVVDVVLLGSNWVVENALRNADLNIIVIHSREELETISNRYQPGVIIIEQMFHEQSDRELNEIWPNTPVLRW